MSREIDAQVAEKVFGAVVRQDPGPASSHFILGKVGDGYIWSCVGEWYEIVGDPTILFPRVAYIPRYSTDAGAAMRVVDRLREAGIRVTVSCIASGFAVKLSSQRDGLTIPFLHTQVFDSMPAAVCEAALRPETLEVLR